MNVRWVVVLLGALVLALGAVACGGDDEGEEAAPPAATTEAAPAATETGATETAAAPAECPLDDGELNVFSVQDLSGVIGDEIGPAAKRVADLWTEKANEEGGILGCTVVTEIADDAFDIPTCLRLYREALQSGDYDVFMGPTNSACMFSLDDLTNAAGEPLVAGIAGDHQPFLEEYKPFNFHPSVSTFLEGRASAVFAQEQGWKRVATIVPNYAYGQDAEKGFREYYVQIVPDGEIVVRQFPEFDEDNFQPFINAIAAKKPDGLFSAFFGPFVVPFWKQWKATGNDDIPTIGGQLSIATFAATERESDIPANAFGFDRGSPVSYLNKSPYSQEFDELYQAEYGAEHPVSPEHGWQIFAALEMIKALFERTQSTEAQDWVDAVEQGDFTYEGPYNAGPTPINPINHMADGCVSVGKVIWDESQPVPAMYDPESFVTSCMHDVLTTEEALEITARDDEVSDEAIAAYEANVEAVKQANAEAGMNE